MDGFSGLVKAVEKRFEEGYGGVVVMGEDVKVDNRYYQTYIVWSLF